MQKAISWLGRHPLINLLLAVSFYLAVVVFHDEVTVLAIKLRRSMTVDGYNLFFTVATIIFFLPWIGWLAWRIHVTGKWKEALALLVPTLALITVFFIFMQTYAIESVHFFQYAILAFLLFPIVRSYGGTVFWTTLPGVIDEVYQYVILTPRFDYFDFNDILLNLLGAALGVVTIRLATGTGISPDDRRRALRSAAIALGAILAVYTLLHLGGYITFYPSAEGESVKWFTINRSEPSTEFWTKAYAGKFIHIIGPWEGLLLSILFFGGYFLTDWLPGHHLPRRK